MDVPESQDLSNDNRRGIMVFLFINLTKLLVSGQGQTPVHQNEFKVLDLVPFLKEIDEGSSPFQNIY
mgnify:FL=1